MARQYKVNKLHLDNRGKKTKEENKEKLKICLWSKTRPASSI
jgi:hypothetical protein